MSSRLVNRPMDTKQRDKVGRRRILSGDESSMLTLITHRQDINQKLQLYGIYQGKAAPIQQI